MFKEMRRNDRQLTMPETFDILNNGEYGILSTMGSGGYPYGVPLDYVYFNDSVYFHCAVEGRLLDVLQANNHVSFCVVGRTELQPANFSTKYKSIILFGTVYEVSSSEKQEVLLAIIHKFSPEHLEAGKEYIEKAQDRTKVFKIKIEQITGKGKK